MIFSSSSLDSPTFTSVVEPALLEDVDGGGRKLIGDENAGGHVAYPMCVDPAHLAKRVSGDAANVSDELSRSRI